VLKGKHRVGFRLGKYERSRPLVIDPTGWYATYLGRSNFDSVSDIAGDDTGNTYVTRRTASVDFPTKGPAQGTNHGYTDVFVVKYGATTDNTETPNIVYATYLGGSGTDEADGIAVNASGQAFVAGGTTSFDFPTKNAFQAT